jgi:hypothetical protein
MAEYVVKGAEPKETVLHSQTPNGYEAWHWLPVRERIVRCGDCKRFSVDNSDHDYRSGWWCKRWHTDMVEPDGFCAWACRKEEDA